MVRPPRKLSYSDSCPQFFKIYIPNQCSQRLRIPPAFVKQFNGVLPYKSIIRSPAKRSWQVQVNTVDNNLYFQKGWHEFVQDNSLEFGDFLNFYYAGGSKFYIKIYGKNGCDKEVTIPSQNPLTLLQENQTFEPRRCKQLIREDNGKQVTKMTLRSMVPMEIQGSERALKAASEFVSVHPFFKVVMKPSYVNCGLMNIPSTFIRSYMEKGTKKAVLWLSGKSCPVNLVSFRNVRARFSGGWLKFARDNTLQAGDVCVFELMERKGFVLKVSIFRCLD